MKAKALVLYEPWATLMRRRDKTCETRGWKTTYRGPLVICAAKRPVEDSALEEINHWLEQMGKPPIKRGEFFPGHAVAVGNLKECYSTVFLGRLWEKGEPWVRQMVKRELFFGNYNPGRYALILDNLQPIGPFPVRGQQGLFDVDVPEEFLNGLKI